MNDSSKLSLDNETKEMLLSFATETSDSLDKAEPIIEDLAVSNDSESVNTIFRVFHTIKGISGFFGLTKISKLTHEGETLLDVVRKSGNIQSNDTVNLIYENFDLLRRLIAEVCVNFTDDGFDNEIGNLIVKIKNNITSLSSENNEIIIDLEEKPEPPKEEPLTINIPVETEPIELTHNILTSDNYDEELLDKFIAEANDLLNDVEKLILDIDSSKEKSTLLNEIFRIVHSLKGNSGFLGLAELEKISSQTETILDDLRKGSLSFNPGISTFLLDQIDEMRQKTSLLKNRPEKKEEKSAPVPPVDSIKKMSVIPAENKTTAPEIITESPKPQQKNNNQPTGESTKSTQETTILRKEIRVDTQKLDKLFDLVGELITIESMVRQSPDLAELELPNFTKSANMLNKITRELQEVSMAIRMTPLEGLFNKMKRLVRDLSMKSKKNVEFKIFGAETEMDKNVIEEIGDPLVHLIRNSIDHGIESAEIRKKSGKPEAGTVILSAEYEGNEILISIEDDGAGLDRDKIIKKAIEKGLLKASHEKLSDREIWNLIFEPGFSTAEKVTEISGRGVGMDVVKRNIEKLRGKITIESKKGIGSKIVLRIPLTLAIMDSLLVQIGDTKYALPILSIYAAFRPKAEDITVTMDGLEIVKVRKEIYPIIRAHEVLKKEPVNFDLDKGILVLCESRENKACIFVDDIVGQQQTVIKGLSDYLAKASCITGCMIQGNGEVGLILDIDSILTNACKE